MAALRTPPSPAIYRARLFAKRMGHISRTRLKLRRELRFSFGLVSEGWRAVAGIPPQEDVRGITASLASDGMASYDSLVHLAAWGYDKQALMLWRPMFERMLISNWATNHPELALKRFEEQHRHAQLMTNRLAAEMPDLTWGQMPFPPPTPAEEAHLDRTFGLFGSRGVTGGRSVHKLVEDMAGSLDEFEAHNLTRCHRTAYLRSNEVLHATSEVFANTEGDFLTALMGSSKEVVSSRFTLFCGFWTLMRLLDLVEDQLHPVCRASIRRLEMEGWLLFGEAFSNQIDSMNRAVNTRLQIDDLIDQAKRARRELAETDQLSPCSCGSGKPYGECHREYHSLIERWADVPKYGDGMMLRPDASKGTTTDP